MILYVNGDSHSAGAEVANIYCFANDEWRYQHLGRAPHPDNLRLSYGQLLADQLGYELACEAESAGSNDRIFRTLNQYLETQRPDLIVIGWPTWEREEWLHRGVYYQLTASGTDSVPFELRKSYKEWVIEQSQPNVINQKVANLHQRIYDLHCRLKDSNIKHLFFNTFTSFASIPHLAHLGAGVQEWNGCYVNPYSDSGTYYNWLKQQGFKTVNPNSYHFGADAHRAWAEFLYQNYVQNLLTT
jgi:hypothetical protein